MEVTPIRREDDLKVQVFIDHVVLGSLEQQYSEWILKNFIEVSKLFGVTFLGLEDRILTLIQEIKNMYMGSESGKKFYVKASRRQTKRGSKELKRLQCSINYEGKKEKRKEGGRSDSEIELMIGKITSWNVKSLNDKKKIGEIRGCLQRWKPDIICLQKTKMEDME